MAESRLIDAAAVVNRVEERRIGRAIGFRDNMELVGAPPVQVLHLSMVGTAAQGDCQALHAAGRRCRKRAVSSMAVSIEPAVRQFIAQNFMYRERIQTLTDEQSLLEQGLIDSTGVLELVCFLEENFTIRVGDNEVIPENLDSVQQISSYVRRKLVPVSEACVA